MKRNELVNLIEQKNKLKKMASKVIDHYYKYNYNIYDVNIVDKEYVLITYSYVCKIYYLKMPIEYFLNPTDEILNKYEKRIEEL